MARRRRIRFGVVGLGGMGQGHCRSMAGIREVELAAVCDADEATACQVGAEHGVAAFCRLRDLIRAKCCDAVLVATPHPVRPPLVIQAMRSGLHVLSEKPLSERVRTADQMIAAARSAGVAFGVMFQRRTEPVFVKALEIVRQGLLGSVQRTTLICLEYRSQAYYDSGGWRATWSGEGGGVMLNQAPHLIDLFLLLGGCPVAVDGRVQTRLHHIEVEDHAEAFLTYPNGGTGYVFCTTNEPNPGTMIEIVGDRGKLVYREDRLRFYQCDPPLLEFTRTNTDMWAKAKYVEQPLAIPDTIPGHAHVAVIRNFARHLLHGEPLVAPGEEGLHSLELANAVWLSAQRRKPVQLPLNRRAYDAFLARKRRESTFEKKVTKPQRVTDPSAQA